ncbi:MAG: ThiF family adenylyltransferase, partial [Oscillospiraceae bacterium]|nr:ThiF family adenylyltransferase [Oscillospiraceae bacterium]
MEERYIRNLGALSEEECAQLRKKTVLVAGCGGLGGYLIEMLLRLGVGEIRAADGDRFEASNLNRQLLSVPGLLGKPKAEAAAERAETVNPDVRFLAVPEFVTETNVMELVRGCDAV